MVISQLSARVPRVASEDLKNLDKIAVGAPGALRGIHKHWRGSVFDKLQCVDSFYHINGVATAGTCNRNGIIQSKQQLNTYRIIYIYLDRPEGGALRPLRVSSH